jgi:hypothetical protein
MESSIFITTAGNHPHWLDCHEFYPRTIYIQPCFCIEQRLGSYHALIDFKTLTVLNDDWTLSPADTQEDGATKKPTAKVTGSDNAAVC